MGWDVGGCGGWKRVGSGWVHGVVGFLKSGKGVCFFFGDYVLWGAFSFLGGWGGGVKGGWVDRRDLF